MAKTDLNESLRTRIDALVSAKDTVLFMKGQKMSPQCGFSARVVHILNTLGADYNETPKSAVEMWTLTPTSSTTGH